MFSKYKGQYGYLKKQPVRIGILALLVILSSASVFLIAYITKGDSKNIFSLIAVLGMLPAAKLIVSFIIQMKAEKFSCTRELKEEFEKILGDSKVVYGYDFYLTSYKENYPALVCVVADGQIILLLTGKDNLIKECREHVEKYLASNSINGYKVVVFDKTSKFFERMEVVVKNEPVDADFTALALIKNLSL